MDAGLDSPPSQIERVVRATEARIVIRNRWYRHRVVWGACGLAVGLCAGVLWQQALMPQRVEARSTSVPSTWYEPVYAPIEDALQTRRGKPVAQVTRDAKPQPLTKAQSPDPIVLRELPSLPSVLPSELKVAPITPYMPSTPITPAKQVEQEPKAEDLERKARDREIRERIATLRVQREELLKSFYEDAIPVKHVDEDIARAEKELTELHADRGLSSKATNG
jgi:hypothetical protein